MTLVYAYLIVNYQYPVAIIYLTI